MEGSPSSARVAAEASPRQLFRALRPRGLDWLISASLPRCKHPCARRRPRLPFRLCRLAGPVGPFAFGGVPCLSLLVVSLLSLPAVGVVSRRARSAACCAPLAGACLARWSAAAVASAAAAASRSSVLLGAVGARAGGSRAATAGRLSGRQRRRSWRSCRDAARSRSSWTSKPPGSGSETRTSHSGSSSRSTRIGAAGPLMRSSPASARTRQRRPARWPPPSGR